MRVFMDLVVNHTSDEHEWFKESARALIILITITTYGARVRAISRLTTGFPPLKAEHGSIIPILTNIIFMFSQKNSPTLTWIIRRSDRKSRISCDIGLIWALTASVRTL